MSPSLVCYPQPGKPKSRRLCEALARGAGGRLCEPRPLELEPGAAGFYGVVGLEDLYRQAVAERDWYYADNAHFDCARGTHFRVAKNALQDLSPGAPEWKRYEALGLAVKPWTRGGRHVVVAMQSEHFMAQVARWPGGASTWQDAVLRALERHTDRPIVVRHWVRDKAERAKTLHQDLEGAWALVTHASAAANEALLAGVPVFVTGRSPALSMGLSQLQRIEDPRRPDGREQWAAVLAGKQWTIEEIESGTAWRALHGS